MDRQGHDAAATRRLLHTAALADDRAALAAWTAWRAEARPWQLDPACEWWFPLVWWNLRNAAITESDRAQLRRAYDQAWIRNQHLLAVAGSAVASLEYAGVDTLVLKGAALALTAYERMGLRPFGDVDVLVRPATAEAARRVLGERGWTPIRQVAAASLRLRHSLGYTNGQGIDLDLHWVSLRDCAGDPGSDRGFWTRAVPLALPGVETRTLSPADHLLHVIVHGLGWAPVPTNAWTADAIAVLRRAGDRLRWDVVAQEARGRHLSLQVRSALDILRRDHGALVPAAGMNEIGRTPAAWWERAEYGAKRRPPTIGPLVVQLWCQAARRRGHLNLPRIMADVRAMTGADGWWPLAVQGAARALARGSPASRTFGAYGRLIRIDVERGAATLVDAVLSRLPHFERVRPDAPPDRVYEIARVRGEHGGKTAVHYRLSANHRLLASVWDLAEAATAMAADLQNFLAATAPDVTFVHAGVVGVGGRAVVLPGASGAGKSTLVAALLRAGATYVSDEYAVVAADGRVEPFARPIVLRSEGLEQRLDPQGLRAQTAVDPLPAGTVLFTHHAKDAVFAPGRLSNGDAILRLLSHCPGAETRPVETLARLRALTATATTWTTPRGEADVAAAVIVKGL